MLNGSENCYRSLKNKYNNSHLFTDSYKQFSLTNTQISSIWPIMRVLLVATIPGQREPGSDRNEGLLYIPQISSITEASPSDCLVSGHSLGRGLTSWQRCSRCILQPQPTDQCVCWWVCGCRSRRDAREIFTSKMNIDACICVYSTKIDWIKRTYDRKFSIQNDSMYEKKMI